MKVTEASTREAHLIRRKVIAFIDEKKDGGELASLDLKLMPQVLSIIRENCSFDVFHKIMMTWHFPQLFANPSPQRVIRELQEKVMVLEGEVVSSRKENEVLKRFLDAKDVEIETLKKQKM